MTCPSSMMILRPSAISPSISRRANMCSCRVSFFDMLDASRCYRESSDISRSRRGDTICSVLVRLERRSSYHGEMSEVDSISNPCKAFRTLKIPKSLHRTNSCTPQAISTRFVHSTARGYSSIPLMCAGVRATGCVLCIVCFSLL